MIIKNIISKIDTTSNWKTFNPIPRAGEQCIEDLGKGLFRLKIGDGVTPWIALKYVTSLPKEMVESINGQTGHVVLTAQDVGAQPTLPDGEEGQALFKTVGGVEWKDIITAVSHDDTLQGDGTLENPLGLSNEVNDKLNSFATKEEVNRKQDKLTAGNNITIENDIISSTAQESFFRGRWQDWAEVPNDANSYPEDFNGNRTPTANDYMVVVDASQYAPGMNDSIVISKDKNSHYIIINGVSVGSPNQIKTYTYDTVTYSVENISGGMVIKLYADKTVQYRERIIPAGATIITTTYSGDAIEPTNLYYSKLDNLSGTWRFGYKGVWAEDNESGWKPEYQIEETLPIATETQAGINKLYTAGDGIEIKNNIISNTRVSAEWGKIEGTLSNQTDLKDALDDKLDKVTDKSVVYGTDDNGNQTTYSKEDFGKVDDVQLNGTSIVVNKVANIEPGANDIAYTNSQYPTMKTLQDAMDKLLYVTPTISISGGGNYEIGSSRASTTLKWTWNKNIQSQSLNQGIGSLDPSLRTYTYNTSISSNTTFTITGTDGTTSKSASTSVQFLPKRYWGVSEKTTLTDAEIIALSSELSTSRKQSRTFNCSGGKYFYFVIKTSYCSGIAFKVGGLSFSDMETTTRQFTNASGHTDSYNIYRVKNLQTGSAIAAEVL